MATNQLDVPRRMTIEEFQRLPEDDWYLYELDEGVLVREPRPARPHGTAVILMGKHLADYALEHGGVVTSETGYIMAGAPDLVVEVLSPSNRWKDVRRKIDQYFAAGASLVWIVDPDARSVTVHPAPDRSRTIGPDATLDGGPVMPGFSLPVEELFRF